MRSAQSAPISLWFKNNAKIVDNLKKTWYNNRVAGGGIGAPLITKSYKQGVDIAFRHMYQKT